MSWVWQLGGIASQIYQDASAGGFVPAWAEDEGIIGAMKKNVAGQTVSCNMITISDGSDFASTVIVHVTGDGGTQAAGSGSVVYEGNGLHTYFPTQGETNYDHVVFTFKGTGALTKDRQVYPTFPQTGDSFARLGAPAGASTAADIAATKTVVDNLTTAVADVPTNAEFNARTIAAADYATATALQTVDNEIATLQTSINDVPTNSEFNARTIAAADYALEATLTGIKGATFDSATDSLEALRNRGDSAWLTATGFSTHSAADVVTALGSGSSLTALATAANLSAVGSIALDILADTAEIGVAGAGLTNINLPNQTMDIIGNITGNISGSVGSVTGLDPSKLDVASSTLATATNLATVDSIVDALLVIANKLDTMFELDGAVYRYTANALEQAPTGGSAPSTAEIWSHASRTLTAGTNIVLAKGTGITGFNDLTAAEVNAQADLALADVGLTPTVTNRIDEAISTRLASSSYTAPLDAAGTRGAVGLAEANLDAKFSDIPTNILDLADGIETNRTLRQAIRIVLSSLAGKLSGAATSTITIRDTNDSKNRIIATVDENGNRTNITYDAS